MVALRPAHAAVWASDQFAVGNASDRRTHDPSWWHSCRASNWAWFL